MHVEKHLWRTPLANALQTESFRNGSTIVLSQSPYWNTTLLSIHVNAAGNGRGWMSARGWCAYTFPGKTLADPFADCLYEAAEQMLPSTTKIAFVTRLILSI